MRLVNEDRVAPVEAVRRAADGNVSDERAALQARQGQGRNHPDAVLRIVCHGRISRRAVVAVLVVHSQTWEITVMPGLTAIGRGGKADVTAAPSNCAGTPGNVKRRHNSTSPCEHG